MESKLHQHGSKILPTGVKVKIQIFQNMVMSHTKLKGITNAASW